MNKSVLIFRNSNGYRGIMTSEATVSRDIKILREVGCSEFEIMSVRTFSELNEENYCDGDGDHIALSKETLKEYEMELMYQKYSIDAWEEKLLYEKDCNTLYDEYESLSKEDEDNFLRHCCSVKAKELFESLPYEDYEIQLIGQALAQLAIDESWKQF